MAWRIRDGDAVVVCLDAVTGQVGYSSLAEIREEGHDWLWADPLISYVLCFIRRYVASVPLSLWEIPATGLSGSARFVVLRSKRALCNARAGRGDCAGVIKGRFFDDFLVTIFACADYVSPLVICSRCFELRSLCRE